MKKPMNVTVSAERQHGKTHYLTNSIITHATDSSLSEDFSILVTAPNRSMLMDMKNRVVNGLKSAKVKFIVAQNKISIGKKTISFVGADPMYFIALKTDIVFIDQIDYMKKEFRDFLDMMIRPYVVVVESCDSKSLDKNIYLQDI